MCMLSRQSLQSGTADKNVSGMWRCVVRLQDVRGTALLKTSKTKFFISIVEISAHQMSRYDAVVRNRLLEPGTSRSHPSSTLVRHIISFPSSHLTPYPLVSSLQLHRQVDESRDIASSLKLKVGKGRTKKASHDIPCPPLYRSFYMSSVSSQNEVPYPERRIKSGRFSCYVLSPTIVPGLGLENEGRCPREGDMYNSFVVAVIYFMLRSCGCLLCFRYILMSVLLSS